MEKTRREQGRNSCEINNAIMKDALLECMAQLEACGAIVGRERHSLIIDCDSALAADMSQSIDALTDSMFEASFRVETGQVFYRGRVFNAKRSDERFFVLDLSDDFVPEATNTPEWLRFWEMLDTKDKSSVRALMDALDKLPALSSVQRFKANQIAQESSKMLTELFQEHGEELVASLFLSNQCDEDDSGSLVH